MSRYYYLYAKDIQEYLSLYRGRYGKKITFAEAVLEMYAEGKTFSSIVRYPDYSSWDITDIPQLAKLYDGFPVDVTYFLGHPKDYQNFVSEKTDIFSRKDADILLPFYDEATKIHQHDFFEIAFLLSGTATLYFEDEKKSLVSGDFCILSPYTRHDVVLDTNTILIDILIRKSTFENSFHSVLQNDDILSSFFYTCMYSSEKNYLQFTCTLNPYILNVVKNLMIESVSSRPYSNEVENLYVSILLAEIMRSHTAAASYYHSEISSNVPVSLILSYIKNNYQNITLKSVADFFGYDSGYLGKVIKTCTNMYYNDIINKCKIDHAARLLKNSDYPLATVGEQAGFNSYDHFCKTFKRLTGQTPGQYRKNRAE